MLSFFQNSEKIYKYISILLFILFVFILVKDIGIRRVERWDEETNIEVVRQSVEADHQYLSLNGSYFFEKPPLWYLITIFFVRLFGDNVIIYRIISVISASLSILFLYFLIIKFAGPKKGMLFLLLNFLIPQIYQINPAGYFSTHTFNSADLDALQMLFIVLAFFLIFYNFKNKALSFLLSYFFLGLGYLTKGPLVFLPLVMNSIYIFKHGVKLKSLALGITVFLMPILIWYGFMIVNFGSSFLNEQLNYHVYQRAFSTLEGHSEPIYFYIQLFIDPRVNLLGIPFILVFLNKLKIRDRQRKIRLYSFLFIVITLLIITIANTRLAWYIIPIYPFLALFLSI